MKKITSFTVNHILLSRGVFVSRKDSVGSEVVTTFDIRMKKPNREPVFNTAEIHTLEHLGATFLRNHGKHAEQIIYFGPMGCRTGFYLIIHGDLSSEDVLPLITEMFEFMSTFEGDVPGASDVECGNFLDMNLPMAKYESKKFLDEVIKKIQKENLYYPE